MFIKSILCAITSLSLFQAAMAAPAAQPDDLTPTQTDPTGPAEPTCLMSTALPSWEYAIELDAHAPGVNTDCGVDYLNAMRARGMDISTWWCYPFDDKFNAVALADASAKFVVLTFWTVASSASEIQGAIWDASNHQYSIGCSEYEGNMDKPDMPENEPGESIPEEVEPEAERAVPKTPTAFNAPTA